MMLPLLLLVIAAASAKNCSHYFDGNHYTRSTILTTKGLPTNLVHNPNNKDLLFTLIDIESLNDDHVQTKMDQYVLRNGGLIKVDIINGQAAAVDVINNKVYIGTESGLAVMNETLKANFINMINEDIVQLFKPTHENVLYATLFPDNEVFIIDLDKNEKTKVENIPCAYFLAVDDKDNIYYECNSKYVKVLLKGFHEPIEYVGIAKNSGRAIAVDKIGRAVLASNDGLYHLRPDNMIPVKLMDLDITPAGLAFEGDDIYLSTNGVIYKYSMEGSTGHVTMNLFHSFIISLPVIFILIQGRKAEKCDRTKLGHEYFKRQLIATIDGYPTGIVIDSRTDNIFFILHKRNYTKGIHLLKHGSLGIKELPVSDDLVGQCVAIDDTNGMVYIGTNQGLVTYDYSRTEITGERPIGDDDIRNIFIDQSDNQMYITTGSSHEIFKFINGSAAVKRYEKIPRAYSFVLDAKGNVFYEYVDGRMYFFSTDYYEPVQYKGFTRELKYILQMNVNDEAIVAVKGSLFKLTTKSMLPQKIGQLGFKITGMAFDTKNNMVVGTKGKLYKYNPIDTNDPCPADDYFMSTI
ncbi:Uncharacterized protein OBRU01_03134 [Operophtera brumata]|uniref:Ommochrome-binding protein n=1 Tax=Operophtera brumata TaxID=104452 RepID=A0A0L7LQ47_OPEBR|nr:Uncharacterized protein OBRU01_03134 [Operophtera brumata]